MIPVSFLRIALKFLIATVLLSGLMILGAAGIFGEPVERELKAAGSGLAAFLAANDAAIDRLWKLLSGIVTILSGCWAIYKSWRYAEINLPQRIEEFLKNIDARLDRIRPMLLDSIESSRWPNRPFRAPVALAGPLNDALRAIGYGKVDKAVPLLRTSAEQLKLKKKESENYTTQIDQQIASTHLLQGAALAAQASMRGQSAGRALDKDAFAEFNEAVRFAPNDPETFFYRGRQSMRLGNNQLALGDFAQAINLTEDLVGLTDRLRIIRARSLYCAAQIVAMPPAPSWGAALNRMAACIPACPDTFKQCEEYAEMNEFRGDVQLGHPMMHLEAAKASYSEAANVLAAIGTTQAKVRGELVEKKREAVDRLLDPPNVADGAPQ